MPNFSQIGEVPWPRPFNITRILQSMTLKVPRNLYHGLFSVNEAEETKAKTHVFRQRGMSSTQVGPERRTSTCFPPVMRSGPFGFSLILRRSRCRPCCRCLKSLIMACTDCRREKKDGYELLRNQGKSLHIINLASRRRFMQFLRVYNL